MKRLTFGMMIFAATVLAGAAWAEDEKQEQRPLRLELNLVDGSRVIGVPGIEAVPVETSYAKMSVPLRQIRTMRIGEDHETVSFDLQNGDKIKGVINLKPIKLTTVFGPVSIGVEHIRQFTIVRTGDALPESLRKGLVLYYNFDGNEDGKVTDQSDKKNHGKLQGAEWIPNGKAGGAYRFDGVNNSIVTTEPIGIAGAAANTVCAWSKSVNNENMKCIWSMGDGHGGGENAHGPALHGDFLGLHYGGIGDTITTRVDPKAWNFVCRTYDGTTQFLYLNGVLIGKERRAMSLADNPLNIGRWKAGDDYGYYFNGTIDEVMVFDRALSEDEVKQLYEAQK